MKGGIIYLYENNSICKTLYIYSEYSFITNFFDFSFQAFREESVFYKILNNMQIVHYISDPRSKVSVKQFN
jgi:hypothetical protein